VKLETMSEIDVRIAYRRWAPFYDATFGRLIEKAICEAATIANSHSGKLLEVGVGTGLALQHYDSHLDITGVDLSREMLTRARERVAKSKRKNISCLLEMDASSLQFDDQHFDVTVAMFVLTVVPDPKRVMHELARVTKQGGTVLIINHFSVTNGLRGTVEKAMAKHSRKLGWRPEFPIDTLLVSDKLRLCSIKTLSPFGVFSMLQFRKL
jgi:phosphatidylethanolamine/phosphatidyl-N-methylethanolamine N-methyltransferase